MEVILHAGQHKTGTSAIQAFLRDNRAELARGGLYVPRTGMFRTGSHHMLVAALLGGSHPHLDLPGFERELAKARPQRLIISAEVIGEVVANGHGPRLVERLRRLGAQRVHIIFYVRSPFALANAMYVQRTSVLWGEGQTFRDFVRSPRTMLFFDFANLERLGGDDAVGLTVKPYDAKARRGAVQDLLRTIGMEKDVRDEPRLNPTLGPMAVEALRRISLDPALASFEMRRLLRKRTFPIVRTLGERPFWGVDGPIEALLAEADARTDRFVRPFWGRPWRDVLGDDDRPRNVYDERTASPDERIAFEDLLERVRAALFHLQCESGMPPQFDG